ncbi:hypothetical protein JRU20_005002 [Salmonella enterica]|nr:hypothetical protein [Salmonella enterica]
MDTRCGMVVLPDAKISAANTVQVVANSASTITVQPANDDVLINGLPSTTDHSTTLVQTAKLGGRRKKMGCSTQERQPNKVM